MDIEYILRKLILEIDTAKNNYEILNLETDQKVVKSWQFSLYYYIIFSVRRCCMYSDKIYLNPQEILNHDFKLDARGYRPQEVDKYLDLVIRDYTEYNNIIHKLGSEMEELNSENYALKQEIRRLQEEILTLQEESENKTANVTNIDLLRRISQLEKAVFGKNQ